MALEIEVQWRAGAGGEPEPLSFRLGAGVRHVDEVIDRWPGSDYGYVKLRGDDGGLYILRYDAGATEWSIAFYDSGETPPAAHGTQATAASRLSPNVDGEPKR